MAILWVRNKGKSSDGPRSDENLNLGSGVMITDKGPGSGGITPGHGVVSPEIVKTWNI